MPYLPKRTELLGLGRQQHNLVYYWFILTVGVSLQFSALGRFLQI